MANSKNIRTGAPINAFGFTKLGYCTCGKEFGTTAQPLAIYHAIPYCALFATLEPEAFLRAMRELTTNRSSN